MSGMSGMDMGSSGMFIDEDKGLAHIFWYLIAAVAGLRGLRTLIDISLARRAKKNSTRDAVPSRPTNVFSQTYQTILTAFRESSYPAPQPFKGRIAYFFTPPPLGQSLMILTYWVIILIMLFTNVWLSPDSSIYGYKWEKPAFRAAWVSVTQLPLIYALSCKVNAVSIVTGISYERLNWMHRWISRTMFLTLIVHWGYFIHEWDLADFISIQMEIMPMVKYGFAAWAVIGWTVLTGFGLFRDLCYELWLLQHLGSAGVLLWLVYKHVPSYATYNVWMAIGFVAFDRVARGVWSIVHNLHLGTFGKGGIGYRAEIVSTSEEYLKVVVKEVDFKWRAGQHVFLSIPMCGIFESHPFTIANLQSINGPGDLELYIKCHSGFTGKLKRKAQAAQNQRHSLVTSRIFLSGPWGIPPLASIENCDSLIFIASSTGASYTTPLLEHAMTHARFARRINFYWIVRHASQISWFESRLKEVLAVGEGRLKVTIFITGRGAEADCKQLALKSSRPSDSEESSVLTTEKGAQTDTRDVMPVSSVNDTTSPLTIEHISGRPQSFDKLVRPTVEAAEGETMIVACGGRAMMAEIRTYTAALSDERAVHKGTGAQSIQLWTETYGW